MAFLRVSWVAWTVVAVVGVAGIGLIIRVTLIAYRRVRDLNATLTAARQELAGVLETINDGLARTRDGLARIQSRRAGETPEAPPRAY